MARCLIGCGSNVGSRHDFLDRALELLRFMPGVALTDVSRYRDTRPIGGPPDQDVFLNAACLIETDLAPHDVLQMLAAIENTLHRERSDRWGPRTVDLDLLLYDDLVLESESLTLPHPRMATRRFVLEPGAEIAPDLVHPRTSSTLQEMLEAISTPHPHIAVIGVPGSGAPEVAMAIADVTLARLVHAPPEYFQAGGLATTATGRRAGTADHGCLAAVAACAEQLAADHWPDDPHGTVVDYWLHSVRIAAADVLAGEEHRAFERSFHAALDRTVPPHVAIFLEASPAALEERIAFRSRYVQAATDAFAELTPTGLAVCAAPADSAAALARLQDHIGAALVGGAGRGDAPRAVVVIDADDLAQAIEEAVAAVEAMA
jgi:2-amino-4-hydroxy-6-hydroxymethyldihydropteridine diphosphokinase